MAVKLQFFIALHPGVVAVAAQIVPGQVDQHDVLGIFLGVGQQCGCSLPVGLFVGLSGNRSGNRVDVGRPVFNPAVGLGRRTENPEAAEVEIKEVGRGLMLRRAR